MEAKNIPTNLAEHIETIEDSEANREQIIEALEMLEAHGLFTNEDPGVLAAQEEVRDRINLLLEGIPGLEDGVLEKEITERLRLLHTDIGEEIQRKQASAAPEEPESSDFQPKAEETGYFDEFDDEDFGFGSYESSPRSEPEEEGEESSAEETTSPSEPGVLERTLSWSGARLRGAKEYYDNYAESSKEDQKNFELFSEEMGELLENGGKNKSEMKILYKAVKEMVNGAIQESGSKGNSEEESEKFDFENDFLEGFKASLEEQVFQLTPCLEANTPELRSLLNSARERWDTRDIQQQAHNRNEEIKSLEESKKKAEKKLKNELKEDIKIVQREIKDIKKSKDQSLLKEKQEELKKLKYGNEAEGILGQKQYREVIDQADERIGAINKELNVIAHGARDRLKRNRKVTMETLLMHAHSLFIKAKAELNDKEIDLIKATGQALEATEKDLAKYQVSTEKGKGWKDRRLSSANKNEAIAFLASEKGPLSGLNEKSRQVLAELNSIPRKDHKKLEQWINKLESTLENKEDLRGNIVTLVNSMQAMIDEQRLTKAGIAYGSLTRFIQLKMSINHAYRSKLLKETKKANKGKSSEEKEEALFDAINDFNLECAEKRAETDSNLTDDLRKYLGENRLRWRALRASPGAMWKGTTWSSKRLWNTLLYLGGAVKNHPRKSVAGFFFTGAAIGVGIYPAVATALFSGTLYGAYRVKKGKLLPKPK